MQTVIGSGLIMGGISALVLNVVIPESGGANADLEPPTDADASVSGGVVSED